MKAFTLLKAFHHAEEWVTCSELSRRAKIPESSGRRLIQTLEDVGAVMRDRDGKCRPGLALVALSRNVDVHDCLRAAAEEIMAEVSQRLDVTVHLGRLEDGMVTFIAKCGTPSSCPTLPFPGSQFEPYSSAMGKVLLAAMPQDEMERFVRTGELVAMTPHTITDPALMLAELARVRLAGHARDDREFHLSISCIAVPLLDGDGRTVAAMSMTERPRDMTPARLAQVREAMMEAAATISAKVYPAGRLRTAARS